jgi:hypothetical protein
MPDAFECPVVISDQGGNRTPDTRISNPLAGGVDRRLFLFLIFFYTPDRESTPALP